MGRGGDVRHVSSAAGEVERGGTGGRGGGGRGEGSRSRQRDRVRSSSSLSPSSYSMWCNPCGIQGRRAS